MTADQRPIDNFTDLDLENLLETWRSLNPELRLSTFKSLSRDDADELFLELSSHDQAHLISEMPLGRQGSLIRILAPDDAADVLQELPIEQTENYLQLLDDDTRKDVVGLLTYEEDHAGGLMSPRFIRLRPEITIDVAIRYLRAQAKNPIETIQYAYVLNAEQVLLGVVSYRDLLLAPSEKLISEIMAIDLFIIPEKMDQEEVSRIFSTANLQALPVVDSLGRMVGIITIDDIVDVVEEEATEDIQKLGGLEALDRPYFKTTLIEMIRKRAGWLVVLFLGEMFTATAMGYFEAEIERAVVLALFIPLIISSGGNSGSQATSLMIRAMALKEVQIKDWLKVFGREILSGLSLGLILGTIGFFRILLWPNNQKIYGEHYLLVATTVSLSLVGVVLWGSLAGSMLPFALKRFGFDPATSSAPFVATLVDVTGIIIYFTVASLILKGTIL